MRKEWGLLLVSTGLTVMVALGLIRWFAPGLLGIPVDLQMVQVSEELPPFFKGVFRRADYESNQFILKDPYTAVRAKPLLPTTGAMGPHDILGFRNRQIPNVADIVVLGDSQTYGNNAILSQNWPSYMTEQLVIPPQNVYSMAVGGWGAVQYLEMFSNAVAFLPRVVVVAFYTGNDPLESFNMAYGYEHWKALRPDPTLTTADVPKVAFPAPKSESWRVKFHDGVETIFTPNLRYASNRGHPAVRAGYGIMLRVAKIISELASGHDIRIVYTIIPTKELVYRAKVEQESFAAHPVYQQLVAAEEQNINEFAQRLRSLPNTLYVDVLGPLQNAALNDTALYPENSNGHPLAPGYEVIGRVVADVVEPMIPPLPAGPVAIRTGENRYQVFVVKEGKAWIFPNRELLTANGWANDDIPLVSPRDLANVAQGVVDGVDHARFGPRI